MELRPLGWNMGAECGREIWTQKRGPGRALLREKLLRNYPVKLTDERPVAKIVSSIPTFTAKSQKNSRNNLIQKGLRLFGFVINV